MSCELAHRPGGQAVAAGLLAGEALLVDHEHRVALLREPVRGRRAGRTRPHDERVVARAFHAQHRRARRHAPIATDRAACRGRLGDLHLRCVAAPSSVVEKHPTEGLRGRSRGVRTRGRWRTEGPMPNLLPDWHFLRPAGRLIWFSLILDRDADPGDRGAAAAEVRQARPPGPRRWPARSTSSRCSCSPTRSSRTSSSPSPTSTCSGSTDKYVIKSTTAIPVITSFNWPISIDMQAIRDIVVVGIYLVFFGAQHRAVREVAGPQDEDRGRARRSRSSSGARASVVR